MIQFKSTLINYCLCAECNKLNYIICYTLLVLNFNTK